MRTTLDIDPVVLSAARAKARAEGISIGRAVSDLALSSLQSSTSTGSGRSFPVMRGSASHVITDEIVERHRDD